jgi:PAS domain S-box-containing protein
MEYQPEEAIGRTTDFLNGPDTDPFTALKIGESLKHRQSVSEELINYSKSGKKYWIKSDITPAFDDQGNLKNFIAIQSDISELKEFENSITSIARELASLIENANVPIFGIDMNGTINEWNRVTSNLMGYSKNSVMGSPWAETFVESSVRKIAEDTIAKVLQGAGVDNIELPVVTKNKKRVILLLSASPRRSAKNIITGVIFVAQNITELTEYRLNLEKKVEERTRELNEALSKEKELVDLKSRFVSIVSHEFRTPLSTISISSGLIRKYQSKISPKEIDEKLENIEKQVSHMTYMLDDVLLIGKAEAGKLQIQKKEIGILEFFKNICEEVEKSTGSTHQIDLTEQLLVKKMVSDERLLRNITINLLTNAIKFSPKAERAEMNLSSDADEVSITVRDFGIGIPKEDKENLFEPFYRGKNVSTIQGTGLGLSIIKKAVDLLKGSVTMKSEVGKGTEITVTLPVNYE